MMKLVQKVFVLAGALACVWIGAPAAATLTEHMDVACVQSDETQLSCRYRLLKGGVLISALAEFEAEPIPAEIVTQGHDTPGNSAILVLIDTSDPARAAVVRKNQEHIRGIVEAGGPERAYGLASFDSDLEILCGLPCPHADLEEQVLGLSATGKTTELYRNILEAIKTLQAFTAERRLLIVMSDGLAEDLAYHHDDVVERARQAGVIISTIGYPRSIAQSIALQTLRRLSEETGGLFAQANNIDNEIPNGFLPQIFEALDSGGEIRLDLTRLFDAGLKGTHKLPLAFQTSDRNFVFSVPVSLPRDEESENVNAANSPSSAPPSSAPQHSPPTLPDDAIGTAWAWFWYGFPALVFSSVLAIAVLYGYLTNRRRREALLPYANQQSSPHAFLVSLEDTTRRYKIDHTPWRIGRSRNCELSLQDTSVSRLHAEVRRDALGQFTMQDLDSLNGIFINGEAIEMEHLDEGDRVEIGDVGFTFTFFDEDYETQDATVLVNTQTPI